jgi:uncharacterized protein (UPF0332 family)
MMNARDFLQTAWSLLEEDQEAAWRSAVSRAYYAAFHVARQLLMGQGFRVPRADQAHAYLWFRLSNGGQVDVQNAGIQLGFLRQERNKADYDLERAFDPKSASDRVQMATDIIRLLDDLAKEAAILTRVVEAIKDYERNVLREVTWQP